MDAQTLTGTDIELARQAHAGKMWLTAAAAVDTDAGRVSVKGYVAESLIAPLVRWNKLSATEQNLLQQKVTEASLVTLHEVLRDACEVVQRYVAMCDGEQLTWQLEPLKAHWAGGLLDLDSIELELANLLTDQRALKRHTDMATQVARTVRLADYPGTFKAAQRPRRLIAVLGPTNSGKTHDAFVRLAGSRSGVYLGPLRLLALEAYTRLNSEFGVSTSLVTGEERRTVADSKVTASTIEMLDTNSEVDVAVIDEIQMLCDPDRGWAWTQAVIGANASEVWLLGALSAEPAIRALAKRLNLELEVRYKTRKHPLVVSPPLAGTAGAALRQAVPGDAFIVFSRRDALNLRDDLLGHKRSVACIYGALSPEVREREAKRFATGEADVLVATDAIGLGLNLPIRRVVFTSVHKFDGVARGELSVPLLQQIAGRAGRFGMDDAEGRVAGVTPAEHDIVVKLMGSKQAALPAKGFQIAASSTYLQAMTSKTGEARLEALLSHFQRHADCGDGFFRPHVPEEQLKRAAELDALQGLDLVDKLTFSMAPMPSQSDAMDSSWRAWATAVSKGQKVRIDFLTSNPRMADLEEAEDSVRLLSAYRWFAHRLPDLFVDLERATQLLSPWIAVVDSHLKSKYHQGVGGGNQGRPSWYWGAPSSR